MTSKFAALIFLWWFATTASAIDQFDIKVCEATVGSKAILACYNGLKLNAHCGDGTIEQQLSCSRKAATNLLQAQALAPASNSTSMAQTPKVSALPLKLKIKGANWNALVSVDSDCIYTGDNDYSSSGPEYAHLSQVKLENVYGGRSIASLMCKDGSECMLRTFSGDWDVQTHTRGKPYLIRVSKVTIAQDHSHYEESEIAITRTLANVIKQCQSVRPNEKWLKQFQGVTRGLTGC